MRDKILILDFGSQYTQLIARRVREAGVYSEVYPFNIEPEVISSFEPRGIILSGGPESAQAKDAPRIPQIIFELKVPVLGICYGMQTLAAELGGKVESSFKKEFGHARVYLSQGSILFDDAQAEWDENDASYLTVWMSHGDKVVQLPPGFEILARSANTDIAAMGDPIRNFYGIQFHPEVTHTVQGKTIFSNFLHRICKCASHWKPSQIIEDTVRQLKEKIGMESVVLGLSGGVDSSVAAALLHRAVGDQLTCIFVDTGLLRQNEQTQIKAIFDTQGAMRVLYVNAERLFLEKLRGVVDPEAKRKIIGNTFIEVFNEEAQKLSHVTWLAQGTIYPDVIESAGHSSQAKTIKSHHNVGGLPSALPFKLIEPLRSLFKDEVREIGRLLDLPRSLLDRHPFPGPGLGVRILGEVKKEYADLLRQADSIFIEELHNAGYYEKIAQAFCVFLPIKSVGVVGDNRQYEYVIALRAVQSQDFMTAHWAHLPFDLLNTVSTRIVNEVPHISRVTYDISNKPPATIEWE